MKNLIFICSILIILFKTGNVLSNSNIFDVNNIEISNETSKNKDKIVNEAFRKAYNKLIFRLLIKDDYQKFKNINLEEIKKLISYYQIKSPDKKNHDGTNIIFNVSFNKKAIHNFFYSRNILYSDIINTEVIFFPLLKKEQKYFIYSQNFFYENWIDVKNDNLIKYNLPVENIENIETINEFKDNIFKLNISDFFKEHDNENIIFTFIEIENSIAKILINTRIEGKLIKKTLSVKKLELNEKDFYSKITSEIKNILEDLIKSQNLIDVRTPSFLNVKVNLSNNNFIDFNDRLKEIDLIDNFYIQQLNKDFILVKIKYLGKIDKIINKLKNQDITLKMIKGEWQLNLI